MTVSHRLHLPIALLTCFFTSMTCAQKWVWLKGQDDLDLPAVYGPAPESVNPKGGDGASGWTDSDGGLWLFGGGGYAVNAFGVPVYGVWNDLWRYDTETNNWELKSPGIPPDPYGSFGTQGVASTANLPSARRYCVTWTASDGTFWLYGGEGYSATGVWGFLNDLWKYDPATGEWTRLSTLPTALYDYFGNEVYGTIGVESAINSPGARIQTASWTDDDGNLWLFGGGEYTGRQDLWKYNPLVNQWTCLFQGWDGTAVYGTKGVAAPANHPGTRRWGTGFKDADGNLCLFGGFGYAYNTTMGMLNDLWKYNIATNEWTWIHGDTIASQFGTYGTQGQPTAETRPGGRVNAPSWTDTDGNFWIFGGKGFGKENVAALSDLWKYDPLTNQWTWMHGSGLTSEYGRYGQRYVSDSWNMPGSRQYFNAWSTEKGLWLFGGFGFCSNNGGDLNDLYGELNDLWRFGPDEPPHEPTIELPNVFSPNGDGINELFVALKTEGAIFQSVVITNRWGNPVFEAKDLSQGWDGKNGSTACSPGVYFWDIRYTDNAKKEFRKQGFVTLTDR